MSGEAKKAVTVNDVLDLHLVLLAAKTAPGSLEPGTWIHSFDRKAISEIRPLIGALPAGSFTLQVGQMFLAAWHEADRNERTGDYLADSSREMSAKMLRSAFRRAAEYGLLEQNLLGELHWPPPAAAPQVA